jgi:hypothetical protein
VVNYLFYVHTLLAGGGGASGGGVPDPGGGGFSAAERRKRSATLTMRRVRSFSSLARWNEPGASPGVSPGISRARSTIVKAIASAAHDRVEHLRAFLYYSDSMDLSVAMADVKKVKTLGRVTHVNGRRFLFAPRRGR